MGLRSALRNALVDNGFYPYNTAFEALLDHLVYAAGSAVRDEPIGPDPDGLCVCGQPLADHRPPDPTPKNYGWVTVALVHSGGDAP